MAQQVTYTSTDLGSEEANREYEVALDEARGSFPRQVLSIVDGRERNGIRTVADEYPGDTSMVVAEASEAPASLVDEAVTAARAAFPAWSRTSWAERVEALRRVAHRLEADRLRLAAVNAWEVGKVRVEAVGEVDEAIQLIRYYAHCYEAENGFAISMGNDVERAESLLRPWGAWGVISPFNFPLALAAGMLAGVLLAGNTAVFKPDSRTALTGLLLYEHLAAELPPGTLQLLVGDGPEVGAAMVGHPDLDGFAFTGSREVGLQSIARFAAVRPRPFVGEMGGKNPVLVCESADLEAASAGIIRSAFSLSGQKCSATSRVYVHRSLLEDLLERLEAETATLPVGNPHRRETFVGPVIDAGAVERFRHAVAEASHDGRVLVGGRVPEEEPYGRGHYVQPTVVVGLSNSHRQLREELFLPYVAVVAVDSLDQALDEANAVPYGLTAGIFTKDEEERERFLAGILAGTVYVNRWRGATSGAWPGVQAFGGWKDSGSTGRHALGPRYVQQFLREQSRTIAG